MLVLARKVGEKLRIGDDIELVVVEVRGEIVRLGITAPGGVAIYREEVYAAIQAENLASAKLTADISQIGHLLTKERGR